MAEIGGLKTSWLFPDMLHPGKKYFVELASTGKHLAKDGKTQIPFIVLIGTFEGGLGEYMLSTWKVASKEKFNPDLGGQWLVSRQGNNLFFEKAITP